MKYLVRRKFLIMMLIASSLSVYANDLSSNASITYGDGVSSDGDSLEHYAGTIRIGKQTSNQVWVDFLYTNEGHPFNNHRDGFALQASYEISLAQKMSAQVGIGPYYSMNTTRRNDVEYNDKNWGLMATAAVLYYMNHENPGLYLKAEVNHITVPGKHSTDSFMVGVGRNFDNSSDSDGFSEEDSISVFLVNSKTTHGYANAVRGLDLELLIKKSEHFGYTIEILNEGNDHYTARQGIGAQAWYRTSINDKWNLSAGTGPYLATDEEGSGKVEALGLFSLEAERVIGKKQDGLSTVIRFTRIASSNHLDKDMTFVGIRKKLK